MTLKRLTVGIALMALALWGAGCSGLRTAGMAQPRLTPTLIATVTPVPPPPVQIVDRELLGAAAVTAGCDAPPEANLMCATETDAPQLTVSQSAATYARWRLQWQDAEPLTGDEVLALRTVLSGDLSPNLYLVEKDGSRMHVPLRRFGLDEGERAMHVPLREVRDAEGNTPDFAQVNGSRSSSSGRTWRGRSNCRACACFPYGRSRRTLRPRLWIWRRACKFPQALPWRRWRTICWR